MIYFEDFERTVVNFGEEHTFLSMTLSKISITKKLLKSNFFATALNKGHPIDRSI